MNCLKGSLLKYFSWDGGGERIGVHSDALQSLLLVQIVPDETSDAKSMSWNGKVRKTTSERL